MMHGGYYSARGMFPPPPPLCRDDYAAYLTRAIRRRDADAARKIFDEAFYKKIDLVPDWYHLLAAVAQDDRTMVRLLATRGAQWTPEEAAGIKKIYPDGWDMLVWTLGRCGLTEDYSSLPAADFATRLGMTRRIFAEEGNDELLRQTDKALAEEILKNLYEDDFETAGKLLRLRQPEGDIDVDAEVRQLLTAPSFSKKVKNAINALARLEIEHGIKEITLDMTDGCSCPDVIPALHNLIGRIASEQPQRMRLLHDWAYAPAKKHYLGGAAILFVRGMPPNQQEADDFINLCRMTAKGELDPVCEGLKKATAFFTGPAWTPERLAALNERTTGGSSLQQAFNENIAQARFGRLSEQKELLKHLPEIAEAHRKGHYKASYSQAHAILHALKDKYKNGDIPEAAAENLRALKEGGARFTDHSGSPVIYGVTPENYCGKKEPGLAKILLDLGVLRPEEFSFARLIQKAKLPVTVEAVKDVTVRISFDEKKLTGKYAEFFCQVCLERGYPDEFIPQRGKIASYRDKFLQKNPPQKEPMKKEGLGGRLRKKTGPLWPFY